MKKLIALACVVLSGFCHAGIQAVDNTTLRSVAVNGAGDTANPGTSCIRVTTAVSAACTQGWIAIPNNNRALLATALLAKSAGHTVWVYYDDASSQHCPGQAFTACSVISIETK